jgi:hypothetical protein
MTRNFYDPKHFTWTNTKPGENFYDPKHFTWTNTKPGENFYDPKHFTWTNTKPGEYMSCIDEEGNHLFGAFNESTNEVALNAAKE